MSEPSGVAVVALPAAGDLVLGEAARWTQDAGLGVYSDTGLYLGAGRRRPTCQPARRRCSVTGKEVAELPYGDHQLRHGPITGSGAPP